MLCFGTDAYPPSLAAISDAPPVLWCMGGRKPLLQPMVALVGARNASSLGTRMARMLAEGLGLAGYTIVSGLARGIDTAAHQASLKTGTIAVMGGGVDVIYPAENAVLAAAISDQGLRLSEQPMGTYPQARHFPPRKPHHFRPVHGGDRGRGGGKIRHTHYGKKTRWNRGAK